MQFVQLMRMTKTLKMALYTKMLEQQEKRASTLVHLNRNSLIETSVAVDLFLKYHIFA